jgi:hypothetical protein
MPHFIVGTGRSGTTLVHEVVVRHPQTGFISNLDDKLSALNLAGRWNRSLFQRSSARDPNMAQAFRHRPRMIERGRMRLAPSEGWNLLTRQVTPMFAEPCRDLVRNDVTPRLEQRMRNFFAEREAAQQCDVLVHKLTGWPRAGFLHAIFPEAKFIHVVRDGRAVANSFLQMGWWDGYRGVPSWYLGSLPEPYLREWEATGRSFHLLAALEWRMLLEAFERARALLPGTQWLDVRYEDILDHPEEEFARILDFLGLPWTAQFERGLRRHRFDQKRSRQFERDLTPEQLAEMERVMAPMLRRWGYLPLELDLRPADEPSSRALTLTT